MVLHKMVFRKLYCKQKIIFFKLIISSPFRRTKETATIFSKKSHCPVIEDDLLREVDVGIFENQNCSKAEMFLIKNDKKNHFPEGESILDGKNRALTFIKK